MSRIVISYRREDSAAYAGRLYDRLTAEFGQNQVFIDISAIEPGVDFVDALQKAIGAADVLITVIGKDWAIATDHAGKRRIDNPMDFVRLEVRTAIERKIRVIPALVGGATMPSETELPEDLSSLSRRNAIEIDDARFHTDVDRLIAALRGTIGLGPSSLVADAVGEPTNDTPASAQPTDARSVFASALLSGGAWTVGGALANAMVVPGPSGLMYGAVVGALGGAATALMMRRHEGALRMPQLLRIVAGWSAVWSAGYYAATSFPTPRQDSSRPFQAMMFLALGTAIAGFIGGWNIGRMLRKVNALSQRRDAFRIAMEWGGAFGIASLLLPRPHFYGGSAAGDLWYWTPGLLGWLAGGTLGLYLTFRTIQSVQDGATPRRP